MDESISSKHVMEFPLDAFGTKSSPAVMPFGQMMHGSSTSGAEVEVVVVVATVVSSAGAVVVSTSIAKVEEVVVVATVVSSSGIGVGAGVTSGGQQSDSSISP
jgi:hypothetical protein